MRTILILSAAVLSLYALSACQSQDEALIDDAEGAANSVAKVSCALGDEQQFTDSCTLQRLVGSDRTTIVLGRGDVGFRRFVMTADGRGLITADGAEPARVSIVGDAEVEVAVGGDRYRLPATIQGAAPVPAKTEAP
ncbi:hypothetical protein FSZ31_09315 [Sphingorhabdus soli]|uniref:Lipoprotein n=1 Tax=Flavisphingopyxis soli TaxID=2601267 RepID=A0A5C6UAU9_9SPHN|nr:hypothetical protein [Sphingorhabdus soli]TXC69116.1 hypothetical protein FSZ31_09315 [Sphingorhabdus soli]